MTQALHRLGYQQLTSLSSAATLTVPATAKLAVISPESQNVRWRDDGTAPTSTVGMILTTSDELVYDADGLAALKFIEVASSAKLNVSYYG